MSVSRFRAVALYRKLHRTVNEVFMNDDYALKEAKKRIRNEFVKNAQLKDKELEEALVLGHQVAAVLNEEVIQAVRTSEDGKYRLRVRDAITRWENTPFRDDLTEEDYKRMVKKTKEMRRMKSKNKVNVDPCSNEQSRNE